jgi:hypothetical protein
MRKLFRATLEGDSIDLATVYRVAVRPATDARGHDDCVLEVGLATGESYTLVDRYATFEDAAAARLHLTGELGRL